MKKRLGFLINQIHDGGAERAIVSIANYFAFHEYDVFMITSLKYDDEYDLNNCIKRFILTKNNEKSSKVIIRNIKWIKKIRYICKENKLDCLIAFMRESNVRAVISTLGIKCSTIVSVRSDPEKVYVGLGGVVIRKFIFPLSDGCVFQLDSIKKSFPAIVQKKSMVIPNGIDDIFFDTQRNPLRHLIVGVGRLNVVKNFAMLINAVAEVKKTVTDVKLEIYGIGEEEEKLNILIDSLGIRESVSLMGSTRDVSKIYEKADLFVLTSNYEGIPNALLEAMASGVPCIATDCPVGAPRQLFQGEKNGVLVPIGNVNALSKAIVKCLDDEQYTKHLGINGKNEVKRYRKNLIYNKWEKYIDQSCKRLDVER